MLIETADRNSFAGARRQEVLAQGGRRVAERTVVVQLLFPKDLPGTHIDLATAQ
jgi:hypothetical protein